MQDVAARGEARGNNVAYLEHIARWHQTCCTCLACPDEVHVTAEPGLAERQAPQRKRKEKANPVDPLAPHRRLRGLRSRSLGRVRPDAEAGALTPETRQTMDVLAAAVAATMKQGLNALPPERTDRVRELIQLISNAYPATLPGEEVEYLLALLSCLHAAIADVTSHIVIPRKGERMIRSQVTTQGNGGASADGSRP